MTILRTIVFWQSKTGALYRCYVVQWTYYLMDTE